MTPGPARIMYESPIQLGTGKPRDDPSGWAFVACEGLCGVIRVPSSMTWTNRQKDISQTRVREMRRKIAKKKEIVL